MKFCSPKVRINKVVSLLALSCLLLQSSTLYGHFDLDEIDVEKYSKCYNSLPEVEDNHELLKKSPHFSSFLKEAEEVVIKHELEQYVGFRLIHKHFPVEKGQLMVEENLLVNSVPSLVTYAEDKNTVTLKKSLPSSWIFSGTESEELDVFETSTDSAVKQGVELLQQKKEFIQEIGSLVKKHEMNSLMSLALLRREKLFAKEDQIYVEISRSEEQKSIVQIFPSFEDKSDNIRTSWSFKGPKQQKCYGVVVCRPGNDGHKSTSVHHQK